ncbi:transporter [Hymenobacter sp. BT491]|uniref:transporter n=1 Tax=Hymenobacter sp. BT491 TaxID=2766779 RepID=UPI001653A9A1|nr:transporter [Hymenobacter sp. BT491]MBC6989127.1 transporter [Hymenobacter sp. BT491]
MRKTTLLTAAGLMLAGPARTLAQTVDKEIGNADTPFAHNIRPDRPGQTVTTNMLRPGQVQLETGILRFEPADPSLGTRRSLSTALLRVGFFNHIELRASQGYLHALPTATGRPENGVPMPGFPAGFMPLTVGAKFLASTNQDARSQVVVLTEMTLPNGDASFTNKAYEPAARLLISQQLGERFGLEANLGFRQRGFKAADTKVGQYLGTLALNGPLGRSFGFFAETYATWRQTEKLAPGLTSGLYWRPLPGLRLDATAGQGFGGPTNGFSVGAGLSMRVGGNKVTN